MSNARTVALDIVTKSRAREGFLSALLDECLSRSALSPLDRRLTTQLVFGVARRPHLLDTLLRPFMTRPQHLVDPVVMDILRLGTYQLAFLTQIPPHAAVHETVALTEYVGIVKAKGFVNGVLRRIAEVVTDDHAKGPAPDAYPCEDREGHRYRRLRQPLLPDPAKDFVSYLTVAFSWPKFLTRRWLERFGPDACLQLGFWYDTAPSLWLRVNKLKGERADYQLHLAAKNIDAIPGEHPQSLKLLDSATVRDLPGFEEGEFTIQDHSAMSVASALNPSPGWSVLDLCAAPGGKTSHLAELMRNRGKIVACDIDEKRLKNVDSTMKRLGITIVETVALRDEGLEAPRGPFDAALVDVPCSNTGVLGRRPEVRTRLKEEEFEHLIRLQTRLLFMALDRVRPGGVVVYSTCSIEPEENEEVVKGVLRAMKGVKREAECQSHPGRPADGGYWVRLRKPE